MFLFYILIIAIIVIIFFIKDDRRKEHLLITKVKENVLAKTEDLSKYLLLH